MSASGHRPRKRFGQNFLHDPGVIRRIVAAIDARADDLMVEIGPGQGALTRPLLAHVDHLHVVELDRDLAARLREELPRQRVSVHEADALRFDFAALARGPASLRVAGNLPYNISSPLLFHLLEQAEQIRDMHFMLQREVVDRMAASPGGRTFGRLSVMIQLQCTVELLFRVGPGAFTPAPKVDSAVVRLIPKQDRPSRDVLAAAGLLTARAFSQRRKTLRNALKGVFDEAQLRGLGIDPGARPETLRCDQFLRLAHSRCGQQAAHSGLFPSCG